MQTYLALREQIKELELRLNEANSVIFSETAQKIRLPKALEEKYHEYEI